MRDPSTAKSKRRGTFLGGVFVLTVANLFVKVFGFLYKVPLNRLLGDEMANVNAAYSVYTLLYMLSTAGIPVAVSLLVSRSVAEENPRAAERIFRVSLSILFAVGLLGSVALFLLARPISLLNSGGDAYLCLLAISPALLFVCISSVLRGYFQGFGRMTPTAVSGVIEAAGKMLLGLFLVHLVLNMGGDARLGGAYSVLAVTVGIAFGTLYLFLVYVRTAHREAGDLNVAEPISRLEVARRLFSIALPIAASSAVLSLASLIDNQMMRPLLEGYYGDPSLAKAVFSDYSTGAVTLFNMPAVLIYPIASAVVPYLTASLSRGNREEAGRYISSALRMAIIVGAPAALGMSALAHPILSLLFVGDADMAEHAGAPLAVLALAILPLALLAVSGAVLQAVGQEKKPIISMLVGVAVKLLALYGLTPILGPVGTAVGTLLFYASALAVNFFFLVRHTSFSWDLIRGVAVPCLSATLSAMAASALYSWISPVSEMVALALGIFGGGLVYFFAVFRLGGIRTEDLSLLPYGARLSRLLVKNGAKKYRVIK